MGKVLTLKQAAEKSGVPLRTLRWHANAGNLKAERRHPCGAPPGSGTAFFYVTTLADLKAFLAAPRKPPGNPNFRKKNGEENGAKDSCS